MKAWHQLWKAAKKRYWVGFTVPRRIPAGGRVLVHNLVQPIAVDQPHGLNGFRCWMQEPCELLLAPCGCGWSGLPHYRVRGVPKPYKIGGAAFLNIFGEAAELQKGGVW